MVDVLWSAADAVGLVFLVIYFVTGRPWAGVWIVAMAAASFGCAAALGETWRAAWPAVGVALWLLIVWRDYHEVPDD